MPSAIGWWQESTKRQKTAMTRGRRPQVRFMRTGPDPGNGRAAMDPDPDSAAQVRPGTARASRSNAARQGAGGGLTNQDRRGRRGRQTRFRLIFRHECDGERHPAAVRGRPYRRCRRSAAPQARRGADKRRVAHAAGARARRHRPQTRSRRGARASRSSTHPARARRVSRWRGSPTSSDNPILRHGMRAYSPSAMRATAKRGLRSAWPHSGCGTSAKRRAPCDARWKSLRLTEQRATTSPPCSPTRNDPKRRWNMPPRLSRLARSRAAFRWCRRARSIQLDRFEDAERQLLGLLRADASDVEAHGLLVQLRQLRGDEEPLAAMRTAAQASSAPPRLRLAFADAARRAGATTESEAILRELMNTFGPEPMLLSSLTTVLQESGRTSEALDAARASIARLPDDAVVAENFVVAALCAGASPEALPVVEKFRARKPLDQRWITYRLDIARLRAEEEFASWFDPARVVSIVDLPPPPGFATTCGISFRSRAGASIAAPAAESSARPESAPRHPDLAQPAGESRRGNRRRCCNPSGKLSRTCRHVPATTPPILSPLEMSHRPRSSAAGRCGCVVADST